MINSAILLALVCAGNAAYVGKRQTTLCMSTTTSSIASMSVASTSRIGTPTSIPEYFQLTTEIFQGPTATGLAPFFAETDPAPFSLGAISAPHSPLEIAAPIAGKVNNTSIFTLMGNLSPYFPSPGFGTDEFPLPPEANISQLNMLSRHGSRYPLSNSSHIKLGGALAIATIAGASFTGALGFLNTWKYNLGAEILVPKGRQELFDSGIQHYYNYTQLYNPNATVVARATTQDRILKSAENFLSGFFDLDWQSKNVKLEHIIDQNGYNDSLAGYYNCNNSNSYQSVGGNNASVIWIGNYLQNATVRFQSMSRGFNWTTSQVYAAQGLCPYETVAFGYSSFCDLFTFDEWLGFEYSIDLRYAGNFMFQSPTGRAVGIGYVQEILARLQGHLITTADTQDNITIDGMVSTFPFNQTLYFDFSHDTNIASILTAFGLTQFAQFLPTSGPPANQQTIVSHMEPFGARLDIEVISSPGIVSSNRTNSADAYLNRNQTTKYIHFILNQRTIPLGVSFPACGNRTDGWCELGAFVGVQQSSLSLSQYGFACNGDYPAVPYGNVTNGAPTLCRDQHFGVLLPCMT